MHKYTVTIIQMKGICLDISIYALRVSNHEKYDNTLKSWNSSFAVTMAELTTTVTIRPSFQSVVFNSGQKIALRAFYFLIRALTKALTL